MSLEFIVAAFTLIHKIVQGGAPLVADIRAVLANHGVEADTAFLDQVIADAARRQRIAKAEAEG